MSDAQESLNLISSTLVRLGPKRKQQREAVVSR